MEILGLNNYSLELFLIVELIIMSAYVKEKSSFSHARMQKNTKIE